MANAIMHTIILWKSVPPDMCMMIFFFFFFYLARYEDKLKVSYTPVFAVLQVLQVKIQLRDYL